MDTLLAEPHTFLGILKANERGFGPNTTPPPLICGERMLPCLALPLPFWEWGLRPPPRTSAFVFVLAIGCM